MSVSTARPDIQQDWPPLPLAEWADTYDTLHRWLQIVGKTRLRLAPMENHWWQVALYLTARGLTTSPIPHGERAFEVELDFVDHHLLVRVDDGATARMPLTAMSVADFHGRYKRLLAGLGVDTPVWPVPSELADTLRFDQDRVHASYDPDAAHRWWRAMASADRVLKHFRARFLGKCSPSHFWWGGCDLSCTRFSGNPAPPHPGGIPNLPDYVTREAYSHECISAGWWPGMPGGLEEPAFYAYAYPEPAGCPTAPVSPAECYYHTGMREWILPYEAVRTSSDPEAKVLEFCQSTYTAAADLGRWNRAALERHGSVPGHHG